MYFFSSLLIIAFFSLGIIIVLFLEIDNLIERLLTNFKIMKKKTIYLIVCGLLVMFLLVPTAMNFFLGPSGNYLFNIYNVGFFKNNKIGDWLGFWGGYLGSIIAIAGVGWTVIEGRNNLNKSLRKQQSNLDRSLYEQRKNLDTSLKEQRKNLDRSLGEQRKNLDKSLREQRDELSESFNNQEMQLKKTLKAEKEQQFRASRPFFYFERVSPARPSDGLYHSSLAIGEKFGKLDEYLHRSESRDILALRNISGKRMMKVMIKLHYKNGIPTEVFKIGLVNADDSAYMINRIAFNKDWDDIYSYSDTNNSCENLNEVEIFFTTELRERIRLVFDYKIIKINHRVEEIFEYDENKKILENKIEHSEDLDYLNDEYSEGGFNPTIIVRDPQ